MKRENLKLVGVAAVCLSLSGIPLAHAAVTKVGTADKVDGKHAVGFHTSPRKRAGKLVATATGSGRLPNNIIVKAPDANHLDGKDSSYFMPKSAASSFLPVAGKAADSDLLDGKDSSQFLSTSTLTGGYSSIPVGSLSTVFGNGQTAPSLGFSCSAVASSVKVSWPTSTTGLSPVFTSGSASGLITTLGGVTSEVFSLVSSTSLTSFTWNDPSGVWNVAVGYVYSASTSSCSVLTQAVHS